MKVELKRLLFIFVGAGGTIGLLDAPLPIQIFMIPVIGGVFGNWIYDTQISKKET